MAQHCPVCNTRLWTDPLFTPRRLNCPRCGAEFKPTVSWFYFRVLLLLAIGLAFVLIAILTRGDIWLLLLIALLTISLLLLPRLIDFQRIGPELFPSEGVLDAEQMKLELKDARTQQELDEDEEHRRFYRLTYLVLGLLLGSALILILWRAF